MEMKAEDQAGNCLEPGSSGCGRVSVAGTAQSSGLDTSARVAICSLCVSLPVIDMQSRDISSILLGSRASLFGEGGKDP